MGSSSAIQEAVEWANEAARSDLPVILVGPAGSGRSHFARAVHAWGSRASGPFVAIACIGFPESLQGREMFGCAESVHALLPGPHEGGLARAAGGTLVLEGIDRLSPATAETLAKSVADESFRREGDSTAIPLRARIIGTTEAPASTSALGSLTHHEIVLPSLRDRPEDVLPLAAHFLSEVAREEGISPVGFTGEARASLVEEPWPGNTGELRERIRHAVRLAGSGAISAEALMLAADGDDVPSFKEAKRAFETRYVTGLLRRCGGNISRAARLAKKDRKDFYDVIRRTGVDPSDFRQ